MNNDQQEFLLVLSGDIKVNKYSFTNCGPQSNDSEMIVVLCVNLSQ